MISDYAHRVNRFLRATRRYNNFSIRQIAVATQDDSNGVDDVVYVSKSSATARTRREMTNTWVDNNRAALFQRGNIVLGNQILPHARFHRRRNQERRAGVQRGCAHRVVG